MGIKHAEYVRLLLEGNNNLWFSRGAIFDAIRENQGIMINAVTLQESIDFLEKMGMIEKRSFLMGVRVIMKYRWLNETNEV